MSGPEGMTFDDPTLTNTLARFIEPGTNYLSLSAFDGQFTSFDQTRVDVVRNQAPVVNAGVDQFATNLSNIQLTGNVSDDGLPCGITNVCWTLVQGPVANINSSNQLSTTVSLSIPGSYVFRLTVDDGQATNSADVTITAAVSWIAIAQHFTDADTIDHEVGNVAKCLKAGVPKVAVICLDAERLRKIGSAVSGSLGSELSTRVGYFQPDQFVTYLKAIPTEIPKEQTTVRRGYKIKRVVSELSTEQQKEKETVAIRAIADSMRKK